MFRNIFQLKRVSPIIQQGNHINTLWHRTCTANAKENIDQQSQLEPAKKHTNPFAREVTSPINDNENNRPYEMDQKSPSLLLNPEEKERRLKVLQLEVDIANQEGRRVPSLDFFKDHHWENVLTLPSKSARMKYYGFLWQIEMKKESKQRKKEEKATASHERMEKVRQERSENPHINYGLGHVSMFLRVYDSTINHWMNHR